MIISFFIMTLVEELENNRAIEPYPITGIFNNDKGLSSEDFIVDEQKRDKSKEFIEQLHDTYNKSEFGRIFNLSHNIYLSCLSYLQNAPTYLFNDKDEINLINDFFCEYEKKIKPQNKRIYHNPLSCLYIAYKYGNKKAISIIANFFEHKDKSAKDLVGKLRSCMN